MARIGGGRIVLAVCGDTGSYMSPPSGRRNMYIVEYGDSSGEC
jgi:hypothetical protein